MQINYILEYHAKIKSGEIVANDNIIGVYDILVERIGSGEYCFNNELAHASIIFIENYCRHCEGRDDLITLELWQKALLSAIFGVVDVNDVRIFREVVIVIARKNGKSLLASAITAYMAYADGEYGAKIYCLGPKLDQAKIVYENFFEMVKRDEELTELSHKRRSDVYIGSANASVRPWAFNAKKSDGLNPHMVVCDEFAQWPAVAGLAQYSVMKSALGARMQPLILSISTAGTVDDGIYDELLLRSSEFLKEKPGRLLPFLYTIDDVDKWDDINELKKSNPNMEVSVFSKNMLQDIEDAKTTPHLKAEFLMKQCNIKQNSSLAWLEHHVTQRCSIGDLKLQDFYKSHAVGGIDLSQHTDLTAASVVIERDGKLYTFCQFFMPSERIVELKNIDSVPYDAYVDLGILTKSGEQFIDYKDVLKWFLMLEKEYKFVIHYIGYDRNMATYLISDLNDNGFETDDVRQGENLTPVINELEGIIRAGDFFIVDNNLLISHFHNIAMKHNLETGAVKPTKMGQRAKIDGVVSVLCAMTVRQKYWDKIGHVLKNKKRKNWGE